MSRRSRWNARPLLLLLLFFSLNFSALVVYLLRSPPDHRNPTLSISTTTSSDDHHLLPLKPWPRLPSHLPWAPPSTSPTSCESSFGNGFSHTLPLVRRSDSAPSAPHAGWLRCHFSDALRSSICEGGPLRMHPDRILMSSGGEKLETVIGRAEDDELPDFRPAAFEIAVDSRDGDQPVVPDAFLDRYVPQGAVQRHTMRALLRSMRFVDASKSGAFQCDQWVEDPILIVTRFEYANLFHTITDWYSAYVSSRVTGLRGRPHLVFVDGHCKCQLEEMWEALFSSVTYAKNFSGPVCFRHAVLTPLGYETALFKGLTETINCDGASAHQLRVKPDNSKTARLAEFGQMLRASLDLPVEDKQIPEPGKGHNILFVRREDYLAHPRHGGKVQSRLSNEQEVFDALKRWATYFSKCKVNLVNGLFAHMPMKEQIRAIEDASVIIGAHGAGLTQIVAANSKAVILEIISSTYRRPHFALISRWRSLDYHAINLDGSHANPEEVIDKLVTILKNLGC